MNKKIWWFLLLAADLILGATASILALPKLVPFALALAALPIGYMLWRSPRRVSAARVRYRSAGKILQFPDVGDRRRG